MQWHHVLHHLLLEGPAFWRWRSVSIVIEVARPFHHVKRQVRIGIIVIDVAAEDFLFRIVLYLESIDVAVDESGAN